MSTATERAYQVIRSQILSGRFPPEHRLLEGELAELAGVSRTPIREALRRLHADGLVELLANRGARVVAWNYGDAIEVFGLRATLEGYAARFAAERASDEQIQEMSFLAEEMLSLGSTAMSRNEDLLAPLNNQFHRVAIEASGIQRLRTVWEGLIQVSLVQRTFHEYSDQAMRRSLAHHQEFVEALRSRNPDWAESVMRSHHLAAQSSVLRKPNPDADGRPEPDSE